MSHSDVYEMPVPMRRFYLDKLLQFKEIENKTQSGPSKMTGPAMTGG